MTAKAKKIRNILIWIVVILILLTLFLTFFYHVPQAAFLPRRKFFKAFPEYNIPVDEIDYIEFGEYGSLGEYKTYSKISGEKATQYMEKLENSTVNLNWMVAIELGIINEIHNFGTGFLYRVDFVKKNGERVSMYLTYGDPGYQRINGTAFYGLFNYIGYV